jgi:hypothetical protein
MKQKNFEHLLAEFRKCVMNPDCEDRDSKFFSALQDLYLHTFELAQDSAKTRELLDVARTLHGATGPGRTRAEEDMMANLLRLANLCCGVMESGRTKTGGPGARTTQTPALQQAHEVLGLLCAFAQACLEFTRPHDPFSGKRRALAFELLTCAGRVFNVEPMVDPARRIIRKSRGADAYGAAEFLQAHYLRQKIRPPKEVVDELLALAERANSRSTAIAALNALVETGAISDFEACDRMDEWKSAHY